MSTSVTKSRRRTAFIEVGDINMPMGWTAKAGGRRLKKNTRSVSPSARSAKKARPTPIKSSVPKVLTFTPNSGALNPATGFNNIGQRQLIEYLLTWPSSGTSEGQRLGPRIKLSGIRILEQFSNSNWYPVMVHFAILVKRARTDTESTTSEFFRSTVSSSRDENFTNAAAGLPFLYSHNEYSINPDKYEIIMHEKKALGPGEGGATRPWEPAQYVWRIDKYVNLKGRDVYFDPNAATQPDFAPFMVYWWQMLNGKDYDSAAPHLEQIQHNGLHKIYFHNSV